MKTEMITLRVSADVKEAARLAAAAEHRPLSNWIEKMLIDRAGEVAARTEGRALSPAGQNDVAP